jgi:DNA-binding LacI/PurR family transcriptional regulator
LVAATGGDPEREIAMVKLLARQQPSGLVVLSSRAGQAYRNLLPALGVPVVFVNTDQVGEQVFSIATDNEYGGWLATRHLLDLEHRRIAYLTGPSAGRSQQARAAGYRRALQEANVNAEEVLPFDPCLMLAGDGTITAGREALRALLHLPAAIRPTAIFCYNDLSALGLLAEAHVHAVHIPTDLAVVGFDNVPYAEVSLPPLTTVDQRKEEMGRLAVDTILAAYRGEPVSDIHLRGELIVRSST